jgi:hypothetical protein
MKTIPGHTYLWLAQNYFPVADSSNKIDLTETLGFLLFMKLPIRNCRMNRADCTAGFFYGDEDGKTFFPPFVNSFPAKDWKITYKKEWVEIESLKRKSIRICQQPLDYDANLDDSAQVHLAAYFKTQGMHPSVVVHRGHSYWLKGTINRDARQRKNCSAGLMWRLPES